MRSTAIPMAMTWEGRTFQLIGFGLLINVGVTAMTSVPGPFYDPTRVPPLLIGFDFPTTLIGPVCVAGALAAHLILFRALAAAHRGERPWPDGS